MGGGGADLYGFSLKGECAVVTGAAAGLGKAIALELAVAGASIVLVDRDKDLLAQAKAEVSAAGGHAESVVVDIASADGAAQACKQAVERFGRIDVLVNNAGIYSSAGVLPEIDWMTAEKIYSVNLFGSLRFIAEAAQIMNAGSRIINVSSITSLHAMGPGQVHYSATKSALNAITRAAAIDLAPRGIRVNAVLPGVILTEGTISMPEELFNAIAQRAPSGRVGKPEDIGGPVLFLASTKSSYVNGHCLVVDGAWTVAG